MVLALGAHIAVRETVDGSRLWWATRRVERHLRSPVGCRMIRNIAVESIATRQLRDRCRSHARNVQQVLPSHHRRVSHATSLHHGSRVGGKHVGCDVCRLHRVGHGLIRRGVLTHIGVDQRRHRSRKVERVDGNIIAHLFAHRIASHRSAFPRVLLERCDPAGRERQ